jgi:hypothetical protein
MKVFNRTAAAGYALKYVTKYNPEWPSFTGKGGDCTNFVSQALFAGGWTMRTDGVNGTLLWFCGNADHPSLRSHSWANAGEFTKYLSTTDRARKCRMIDLALGDVVQLRDYSIIHHTLIVTGVLPNSMKQPVVFVTYHTNDVAQKPLTAVASEEMLFWKINDMFEPTYESRDLPSGLRAG